MKDFERPRDSEIRFRYELESAREEVAEYQREVEEVKKQLQFLHQRSPSILSSTRTIDNMDDDVVI